MSTGQADLEVDEDREDPENRLRCRRRRPGRATGKHHKQREGKNATPRGIKKKAVGQHSLPKKIKASAPVPERNQSRLSPQLRCQTRFRCGLAKQTQSKLGIVGLYVGVYIYIYIDR